MSLQTNVWACLRGFLYVKLIKVMDICLTTSTLDNQGARDMLPTHYKEGKDNTRDLPETSTVFCVQFSKLQALFCGPVAKQSPRVFAGIANQDT